MKSKKYYFIVALLIFVSPFVVIASILPDKIKTNQDVKSVQEFLNSVIAPSPNLVVDGIFGTKSTQAIKDFQIAHGLAPDGIIGFATRFALLDAQKSILPDNNTQIKNSSYVVANTPTINNHNTSVLVASALVRGCEGSNKFNIFTGALCASSSILFNSDASSSVILPIISFPDKIDTKEEVINIQKVLNKLIPSSPLEINGIFGDKLIEIVKDFQKSQGLDVDGIIGPATRFAILKAQLINDSSPSSKNTDTNTIANTTKVINNSPSILLGCNGNNKFNTQTGKPCFESESVNTPVAKTVVSGGRHSGGGGGSSNSDTTDPSIILFVVPLTSDSLTVPITTFTASDNIAVTGYLLTEDSLVPSASLSSWSASIPNSYTFSTEGSKTLYAWVKDAAGNVSEFQSQSFIISLSEDPDIILPEITAFSVFSTSDSLTVPITTFTASDNIAVTGYLLTEDSLVPSASLSSWSASIPNSYTFSTEGSKTLYAWVKDVTGNVSESQTGSVLITLPEDADITVPLVTSFVIPLTSDSLTVPITTFTANDNVAVTGYLLTETSSVPNASALTWVSSSPTEYTFSSPDLNTLYSWVKDAAGNVSESISQSVTITLLGPKTYYISQSAGDDSRTNFQAQNSATPWKTISKINSQTFQPGDSILFKKGDTWNNEVLNISSSGENGLPITYGSYGSGNRPIISGFTTLSGWTDIGGGIYQSSCSSCTDNLNMVNINGNNTPIGRYPNSDQANGGYLTFESHLGNTSITDNELTDVTNWTGAEVVIRKNNWITDRNKITQHSGNTITYTSASSYEGINGYGYFIQNDPKTLDQFGEWYLDPVEKNIQMYFGANNPNDYAIKASVKDSVVNSQNINYVTLDGLDLTGANSKIVNIVDSPHFTIQNSKISYSGSYCIYGGYTGPGANSDYFSLLNSDINNCNDAGVLFYGYLDINPFNSFTIRDNVFSSIGKIPGMGISGDGAHYSGIGMGYGSNGIFEYNTLHDIGYNGVTGFGSNTKIKNNFIYDFCSVKDDGGGIYIGYDTYVGREITGNIILNGIGAPYGKSSSEKYAFGIYLDNKSDGFTVSGNTIANNSNGGIYLHNAHNNTVSNNTVFNNAETQFYFAHGGPTYDPIRNITINDNIFFSKTLTQKVFKSETQADDADIIGFGASNNNYYLRPMDDNFIFSIYANGTTYSKSLDGWKQYSGQDVNSYGSPVKTPYYIVNSYLSANKISNGAFNSNVTGSVCSNSVHNCALSWVSDKLDGGALQVSFDAQVPAGNASLAIPVGAVSSGKNYILKYSFLGTTDKVNDTLSVYIRKNGSPYNALSSFDYKKITSSRGETEVLFSSPITESDAVIVFVIPKADSTNNLMWFDNIELYDADTTLTNPDDYFLFDYNASKDNKEVSLGSSSYMGVDGTIYTGSVTLLPYSSIVLIKQ